MQSEKIIWCIGGLGSNAMHFRALKRHFPAARIIDLPKAKGKWGWEEYLQSFLKTQEEKPDLILGFSFGGLLAQRLQSHFPQAKMVLVNSITRRSQLPPLVRFLAAMRIHRAIPMALFHARNPISRWILKQLFGSAAGLFVGMMKEAGPYTCRFALRAVFELEPFTGRVDYRIHGEQDQLFPIQYIKEPYVLLQGGHFLWLSEGETIAKYCADLLED